MNIMESRLEEVEKELKDTREVLKSMDLKLTGAQEALRYYANVKNYGILPQGLERAVYQNVLKSDYTIVKSDPTNYIAGKRAREYFKSIGEEIFE